MGSPHGAPPPDPAPVVPDPAPVVPEPAPAPEPVPEPAPEPEPVPEVEEDEDVPVARSAALIEEALNATVSSKF